MKKQTPAFVDVLIKNLVEEKNKWKILWNEKKGQHENKIMHVLKPRAHYVANSIFFYSILQFQQNQQQ